MKLQVAKGTRDFSPGEKIARNELTQKLITIFELYGFSPLETPILERMDVLGAKYAGGETSDVMKEVFRVENQGGREMGLRFDLTVPLARYIGMNPETKMPFKRYQIGPVFRDGPIKTGRYRQFWQYDIDIIGAKGMAADAEILTMVLAVFDSLGIDIVIKVNNRKLLSAIITQAGISSELAETVIISIDKYDKIGKKGVLEELQEKGFDTLECTKVIELLDGKSLADYKQILGETQGVLELQELFDLLPKDSRVQFVPNLARGLAYYTGTVMEVFSANKDLNFSLAGGGRYDSMIGNYLGGKQDIPAVGLAFGFEPILEVMKLQGKNSEKKSVTELFIIPIGDVAKEVVLLASEFRAAGIKTDRDLKAQGLTKNIKYADAYGIPYVLFVGEDELKNGKFTLRDLKNGEEKVSTVKELVVWIRSKVKNS